MISVMLMLPLLIFYFLPPLICHVYFALSFLSFDADAFLASIAFIAFIFSLMPATFAAADYCLLMLSFIFDACVISCC